MASRSSSGSTTRAGAPRCWTGRVRPATDSGRRMPDVTIAGRRIGEAQPTYFIADIAANHDGDLSRAKDLIYLASEAGADVAKFQHFAAATIVSVYGLRSLGTQQSN